MRATDEAFALVMAAIAKGRSFEHDYEPPLAHEDDDVVSDARKLGARRRAEGRKDAASRVEAADVAGIPFLARFSSSRSSRAWATCSRTGRVPRRGNPPLHEAV